jgi:hypothetical protein
MTRQTRLMISIALLFILGVVVWIIFGYKPMSFQISKTDFSVIENLKSFSENGQASLNADAITKKYEATRNTALSKASAFITKRNVLNVVSNILCIVSIIASFIISILGANKGLFVKLDSLESDLEKAKSEELTFKKKLILFSAIAILSTTLSNRITSFADKSQTTAYEIIDLIKSTDSKMSSSININEAKNISSSFELDASKY